MHITSAKLSHGVASMGMPTKTCMQNKKQSSSPQNFVSNPVPGRERGVSTTPPGVPTFVVNLGSQLKCRVPPVSLSKGCFVCGVTGVQPSCLPLRPLTPPQGVGSLLGGRQKGPSPPASSAVQRAAGHASPPGRGSQRHRPAALPDPCSASMVSKKMYFPPRGVFGGAFLQSFARPLFVTPPPP